MSNTPFFSVIIPTFNRAHLISKTIKSVLAQEFTSYEVIIVDDGSTDNTEEVINGFHDSKIVYYKKINGERGAARNFGWRKAKGIYVTFLDSDDVLYPVHLQSAYDKLQQLALPNCLAQAFEIKDSVTGHVIMKSYRSKSKLINKKLLGGNFLACFGVFLKNEVITEVAFEEERAFAGTEDWLFWLQLAARYPFYFSNKITGALTHHKERSVLSMNKENLLFRPAFIKEKLEHDEIFIKTFGKNSVLRVYAHVLSYVSLSLAGANETKHALSHLWRTAQASPKEFFRKRTFGIVKTILLK